MLSSGFVSGGGLVVGGLGGAGGVVPLVPPAFAVMLIKEILNITTMEVIFLNKFFIMGKNCGILVNEFN